MDKPELEFRDSLQLLPRSFYLRRVQSGDLDQDVVGPLLGDHRFANTEFVHPFSDDLDRLLLHFGCDRSRRTPLFENRRNQPNQKGGAALQIQSEMNFLLER